MTQRVMGKRELDALADKIDAILSQNGIRGHCTGGTLAHNHIRIDLATHATPIAKISALTEEFNLAFGKQCQVDRVGTDTVLILPLDAERPTLAGLLQEYKNRIPAQTAIAGVDKNHAPLMIQFAPHDISSLLVVGQHGRQLVTTLWQSLKTTGNDMQQLNLHPNNKLIAENRIGRFSLHRKLIFDADQQHLCAFFGTMIVVKAEADFPRDCVDYVAYSTLFAPIPDNETVPEYRVLATVHADSGAVFSAENVTGLSLVR